MDPIILIVVFRTLAGLRKSTQFIRIWSNQTLFTYKR